MNLIENYSLLSIIQRLNFVSRSWMSSRVFNYSIFNPAVLSFLKLTEIFCSDNFAVLFWYSQIRFKFVKIPFEFVSNCFQICFQIRFLSFVFFKCASICFRKFFEPLNLFQIRCRSKFISLKNEAKFGDDRYR